ncbi:hypothetical protein BH09ACT13_BH09ACT13_08010 [soil metagenome]
MIVTVAGSPVVSILPLSPAGQSCPGGGAANATPTVMATTPQVASTASEAMSRFILFLPLVGHPPFEFPQTGVNTRFLLRQQPFVQSLSKKSTRH